MVQRQDVLADENKNSAISFRNNKQLTQKYTPTFYKPQPQPNTAIDASPAVFRSLIIMDYDLRDRAESLSFSDFYIISCEYVYFFLMMKRSSPHYYVFFNVSYDQT
ncbi:hypothetical protein TNCT_573481 [Trichonephila clavata]|uniref:Uncharacterized protein n=1 Tax=Trichonephila clavata TaxID=2740835 RepID=A0A8X6IFM9_TRICU|nr:hypothetical protein TNCT_573481 [Trichonephila clavata]